MSERARKFYDREGSTREGAQVVGGADSLLHYGHTNGVADLLSATADDADDEREIIARANAARRDAEELIRASAAQVRRARRDTGSDSLATGTDKRAFIGPSAMKHLTVVINATTDGFLLAMLISGVRGILPFVWTAFK